MNTMLEQRLRGIHGILCSAFVAGTSLSSASKGHEREAFINLFLNQVLPPQYRFGTGDIIDVTDQSGQIDIVIEMPWTPSFPTLVAPNVRLYPAEAVGAAIEVKSNLEKQWDEVLATAQKLAGLRQPLNGLTIDTNGLEISGSTEALIPLYAVGFDGWQTAASVTAHLKDAPLDGALVIKPLIFVWSDRKEYLARVAMCRDALARKRAGDSAADASLVTCGRLIELAESESEPTVIANLMNGENLSCTPIHFGDERFLPKVEPGKWTSGDVTKAQDVLALQIWQCVGGPEALLRFVAVIHKEVSKRAAMVVDLSRYAV